MSCSVCSRVKETGRMFLEGAWLYDDEKFKDALTVRLYLTNYAGQSFLRGTLEGAEIEPPLMTAEIAITHCPFCGGELNGYS